MESKVRIELVLFDPGERQVKSQMRTESEAVYNITESSALKSAYKHASSVGLISLVAGGANGKARSCSRSAVRLSARVCSKYASVMNKRQLTKMSRIRKVINISIF